MTLRIILADDHPIAPNGVGMLLESRLDATVIAGVRSPAALIDAIETHACDLVIYAYARQLDLPS